MLTRPCARATAVVMSVWIALAAVLALLAAPEPAHAGRGSCRSDPIVILNNGATFDLAADIGTAPTNVEYVLYRLHAPIGTRVVAYQNLSLEIREEFEFYADTPPDRYWTETIVYTPQMRVSATATSVLIPLIGLPRTGSAPGYGNQALRVNLDGPQRANWKK